MMGQMHCRQTVQNVDNLCRFQGGGEDQGGEGDEKELRARLVPSP